MTDDHGDHDIHGVVVEVWPDDSITVDGDCDCPPDCADCEVEGVVRAVPQPGEGG